MNEDTKSIKPLDECSIYAGAELEASPPMVMLTMPAASMDAVAETADQLERAEALATFMADHFGSKPSGQRQDGGVSDAQERQRIPGRKP